MPPLVLITPLVIVVLFLGFFCLPVNRMAITSLREQVPGARPLSKAVRKRYAFDDRFLDFPTHSLDGTPTDKSCVWTLSNIAGWGDTLGGMYLMFEACTANRRAFFMDSTEGLLEEFFAPRHIMWSLQGAPRPSRQPGVLEPPVLISPTPVRTHQFTDSNIKAYWDVKKRFEENKEVIRHRLAERVSTTGKVVNLGQYFPFLETERVSSIWGMQATVSRATAVVSELKKPVIMGLSEKGQPLHRWLQEGVVSWTSVKRQADIWFRLLSPSDYLRGLLERTICRTFFLTDHLDQMWRPEMSTNPYQQSLISLLDSWTPKDRVAVVTPLCSGISEVLRLSPWTRTFDEGVSLSQALLRVFRLGSQKLLSEKESQLKFERLEEVVVPKLEHGLFAVHYRTGDTTSKIHNRRDIRNPATVDGVQRCINMADSQGLGVFLSDHATLRHEMQAHPRLIPVSIPNFELLHNAAKDSSQKQIIAWSSLLTEWYLMLQVEELVVTNSGFGGTVGMFFNHKNVYDCPKDIKTV